ncbi:MAG: ribonuclease H-like domain-containing protein, partial [bacterium]
MLIKCSNCGSNINLPEVIDSEKNRANCKICGFTIISFDYKNCPRCKNKVLSICDICTFCGQDFNKEIPDNFNNNVGKDYSYLDDIDYEIIKNEEEIKITVEEIINSGYKEIAIDTETTGLDPHTSDVLLVQISTPEKVYIYDNTKLKDLSSLKKILEDRNYVKILQNAKFDFKMIKQHFKIELNNIFDTMLAERVLTAGISMEIGLKSLTGKYLNRYMDKSIRQTFLNSNGNFNETQLKYAAEDVIVLHPIYKIQKEELIKQDLLKIAELEFKTLIAVGDMELNGIKLDKRKWKELMKNAEVKKSEAEKELMKILKKGAKIEQQTLFGDMYTVNLNSSTQLLDAFKKIGINLPDTSNKTLKINQGNSAIDWLLEYRKYEKLITSFGDNM